MGIEYVFKELLWCPVIRCDVCHRMIEDAKQANMEWMHDNPSQVYFVHKSCDWAFRQRKDDTPLWGDLSSFLHYLHCNMHPGKSVIAVLCDLFSCRYPERYHKPSQIPAHTSGVYLFSLDGYVKYVGQSIDVKRRVASHSHYKRSAVDTIDVIKVQHDPNKRDALEGALIWVTGASGNIKGKRLQHVPSDNIWLDLGFL